MLGDDVGHELAHGVIEGKVAVVPTEDVDVERALPAAVLPDSEAPPVPDPVEDHDLVVRHQQLLGPDAGAVRFPAARLADERDLLRDGLIGLDGVALPEHHDRGLLDQRIWSPTPQTTSAATAYHIDLGP